MGRIQLLLGVFAACCLAYPPTVVADLVIVGDSGNAMDTRYASPGFGAVSYDYAIGQHEVTAGEYVIFLNAVAPNDSYSLYNPDMWDAEQGCKIQRSGAAGDYTYSVAPERANRPVNFVSFWDSLRYANWLYNGQPSGEQASNTTEDGSYTLDGHVGDGGMWITRNPQATWVIPTEDEWYKAAFYKGGGTDSGYWDFPTQSDSTPSNDLIDPDPGNNANFWDGDYTVDAPYWTTEVGAFENSESAYGTFDQGGNVWEWNETLVEDAERGRRGGAFVFDSHEEAHLKASNRSNTDPWTQDASLGFRIAYVPEPSTVLLLASVGLVILRRWPSRAMWNRK